MTFNYPAVLLHISVCVSNIGNKHITFKWKKLSIILFSAVANLLSLLCPFFFHFHLFSDGKN